MTPNVTLGVSGSSKQKESDNQFFLVIEVINENDTRAGNHEMGLSLLLLPCSVMHSL
jgi:hypothetical protein